MMMKERVSQQLVHCHPITYRIAICSALSLFLCVFNFWIYQNIYYFLAAIKQVINVLMSDTHINVHKLLETM